MSATLNLKSDGWTRALRGLAQQTPNAIARSLNRSATSANVVGVRGIAADMGLKQADVKAQIRITNATAAKLIATLEARGSRIPLIKFNARDRFPKGVVARLPGGAGRYPRAFIRTMRSGHTGVFQRRGPARLPIDELKGPSIPKVFIKLLPEMLARAQEALVTNLRNEMAFVLRRLAS